ncbi:MAG TPA: phosphatase PAP2 family protein, partial [Terriglobales bacterium]|nr:phosphatase PAP2 family protein [Terriglobales bacterium]
MRRLSSCALTVLLFSVGLCAQQNETSLFEAHEQHDRTYDLPPGQDPQNQLVWPFVRHIAEDQEHFWTLPLHAHKRDLKWILPAAGGVAGLFAADNWISKQIPNRPNQIDRSLKISDYSLYSLIAAGGGSFVFGELSHNDHMRETGLLSAESAINASGVAYVFKFASQRQRPSSGTGEDGGEGEFFKHSPASSNLSFPSEHSTIAWAIASVVAHEYPGTLTKFAAYGLATGVSLTRVTAHQHFTSDVL